MQVMPKMLCVFACDISKIVVAQFQGVGMF